MKYEVGDKVEADWGEKLGWIKGEIDECVPNSTLYRILSESGTYGISDEKQIRPLQTTTYKYCTLRTFKGQDYLVKTNDNGQAFTEEGLFMRFIESKTGDLISVPISDIMEIRYTYDEPEPHKSAMDIFQMMNLSNKPLNIGNFMEGKE